MHWRSGSAKNPPLEWLNLRDKIADPWVATEALLWTPPVPFGEVFEVEAGADFRELSSWWSEGIFRIAALIGKKRLKPTPLRRLCRTVLPVGWSQVAAEIFKAPSKKRVFLLDGGNYRHLPVRLWPNIFRMGERCGYLRTNWREGEEGRTIFEIRKIGEQKFCSEVGRNRGALFREGNRWYLLVQRMGYEERKNLIVDPWADIGREASDMMKDWSENFTKRGLPVPEAKGVLNFRQLRKRNIPHCP